ncbi:MAG: hypothetical protein KME25_00740 [Symplocastrum torsivum CPER-KK1]|jgi:hypothetical protein|uniref:Uncharacterized protein n=1 Tax=Symplocastrum torsivum CPER-KK1 TaxID=450513 RepID=A0A951U7Q2_9CYAN|nr:hypothetical protein [Symplocastrum torsivum CPER-KK1]
MGLAVWAALRQVEALRESVAFTLEEGAIQRGRKLNLEEFATWISEQGVKPVIVTPRDFETEEQIGEDFVNLLLSMEGFLEDRYPLARAVKNEMRHINHDAPDFGVHRSGVGYHRLPNFVITSAFVRLLGASEQFEIDVLKCLLYYRPGGKTESPERFESVTVNSEVVTEEPGESNAYSKPPLWAWIKQSAESNVERKKIFKRVYGIDTTPQEFNGLKQSDVNKYRHDLYEKRNAIAHGRANVTMLLSDYCTAEMYVIEVILTIRQQCIDKLKVSL